MRFVSFFAEKQASFGIVRPDGVFDLGARFGSSIPDLKTCLHIAAFGLGGSLPEAAVTDYATGESLPIITNNQAGCILVDAETNPMRVYVTNEAYAKKISPDAYALSSYPGYFYWGLVERK